MKKLFIFIILLSSFAAKAQKIADFEVNLYTDSLKVGTYNYINVDGITDIGKYIPLDSTQILFSSEEAKFYGNTIFIPAECKLDKVKIRVALKNDLKKYKEFDMYIKRMTDPPLQSEKEIIEKIKADKKKVKIKEKG